ncbi:TetR family transcriptional regulator [Subtercola lobariae]|nr:TetR/AcrR family transcriptional regulator C-terminal domain-containing protein [Subtercola lobariae]
MTEPVEVSLPHAVALSWGIAERPERGPKRELSIERIVESAIDIADVEGLSAVSMSRVATSLGFTTMSLYRYVTSKDDLLLLMQDQALDMPIPPEATGAGQSDAGWRLQLREWVLLTRQTYLSHPWYAEIPVSGLLLTPMNLRLVDWGVRCLAPTGLSGSDKLAIVLLAGGYARSGGGGVPEFSGGSEFAVAVRELVTEERFPYLRPVILEGAGAAGVSGYGSGDAGAGGGSSDAGASVGGASGGGAGVGVGAADSFEFGLERLLDGIEHYLGQTASQREHALLAASTADVDARLEFYPKDPAVREAAAKRREAEGRLREAQKREREMIAKARERAAKLAARSK